MNTLTLQVFDDRAELYRQVRPIRAVQVLCERAIL